jgi:hypothetical protein
MWVFGRHARSPRRSPANEPSTIVCSLADGAREDSAPVASRDAVRGVQPRAQTGATRCTLRGVRASLLVLLLATNAFAELHHRLTLWGGSELTVSPEVAWHGIGRIRYELSGLPRGSRLVLDFNSDTLRVSWEALRFGRLELGAGVGGEVLIAGLLGDYWRDGHRESGRGFRASWAEAGAWAKLDFSPSFLELSVFGRRWFFGRQDGTSANLILPPEAWVGEWRLRYTLWSLAPDPSLWEAQRPFPRLRGVAFGLELSLDARSEVHPWGARDASFTPPDPRNDPSALILGARQWLRAGFVLFDRVRLQLEESALWMSGADDLVRARIGALNPWVVPVAGQPWAGHLADKLVSAQLSLHFRVWRELELGPLVDAVILDDIDRDGNHRPGSLFGVGAFVDFRLRGWQVDVRAGYSAPDGASLFASLGWGWYR